MDRNERARFVTELCEEHGCNAKIAKIHFEQFVNHNWHPHPSADFGIWWKTQPGFAQGIDVKRAFNCQNYRDRFLEAKQYGLPSVVPMPRLMETTEA